MFRLLQLFTCLRQLIDRAIKQELRIKSVNPILVSVIDGVINGQQIGPEKVIASHTIQSLKQ